MRRLPIRCPQCGDTNVQQLYRTYPVLAADVVPDDVAVHVPVFYVCQCSNGHRSEIDVAWPGDDPRQTS